MIVVACERRESKRHGVQPRGFRLWVFQRNTPALAFYARLGCVEVRRTTGEDNAEREPDVCLRWAPPA